MPQPSNPLADVLRTALQRDAALDEVRRMVRRRFPRATASEIDDALAVYDALRAAAGLPCSIAPRGVAVRTER